ncbi:TetR/AcrR family transcriptional regulator [Microterricola viridarii]|uniref:TetR/AcrR family transcriptional regulator n=1 Tax=Microterricola viridarii TaxID=412690 RepID=UPI0013665FC5|nr:TetR/AcrR family transcriptional regulator [Microterricola viridarii]
MPEQAEVSPRSGGYATGRATKKAIVASAAHAFAQKGFYGASLRSIAREAGVDHSTLLHHFGNKTNLMLAVVGWHDQQQFLSELPVRMSAQGLVDAFVSTAESNVSAPGLVQLLSMLTAEAGAEGHPARAVLQRRHDRLISLLAWTIKRQRNRLSIEDELSPEQRAALVIATWDGLQLFDALHPGVLDVPALVGRELRLAFGLQ